MPRRVYWGATLASSFIFYAAVFILVFVFGVCRVDYRIAIAIHSDDLDWPRRTGQALARPRQVGVVDIHRLYPDYWTDMGLC